MSTKLKLIFMGTPDFAVPSLRALVESGYPIVAVYTQPPRPAGRGQKESPSPVHRFALEHGLTVYTPVTLKDEETQRQFREHGADAAIVAAYGLLLPKPILEATRLGCINVHPSLLPRWRGAAPLQRTIMAGDKDTGIVIMQMNEGLDTGDMLMTQFFTISDGTTAGQLHDRLSDAAGPLLVETLKRLVDGRITPVKQPETGVTYAHKITKEEGRIHWNEAAETIRHKILGLSPVPGAYCLYKGETIKILDAELIPSASKHAPGTTLDEHLTVACGEGALRILTVQRPGKKPMQAEEMLRGYPVKAGETLE
ncbi:MAG TPA: methionyl-tRNA formyltransferase [Rickettsiales bacterium]|nr:methionyl-tRNA formyltransferase [Rickettsiales bacterium]